MDYANMVWYAFNGGQGGTFNATWERWWEILGLGPTIHFKFSQHLLLISALVRHEAKMDFKA